MLLRARSYATKEIETWSCGYQPHHQREGSGRPSLQMLCAPRPATSRRVTTDVQQMSKTLRTSGRVRGVLKVRVADRHPGTGAERRAPTH